MRRMGWLAPLLVLLIVTPAYAVFDGSHHDLRAYQSSGQGCYNCHGIRSTAAVDPAVVAQVGEVGALCLYRCHTGTTGTLTPTANVVPMAPSYFDNTGTWTPIATGDFNIVRFDRSHGSAWTVAETTRPGTGFPYSAATNTNLECTSCHAVHDNANPPFVWRPIIGSNGNADGLCEACHAYDDLLSLAAAALPTGNHPINFTVDNAAASTRTSNLTAYRTRRHGRAIAVDSYGTNRIFDVANTLDYNLPASHWNTGGHMRNATDNLIGNYATGVSIMGCATCHTAHFPNNAANAGGYNNLVVDRFQDATNGSNPICTGCHGTATTWTTNQADGNPGVSAYFHPSGTTAMDNNTVNYYNVSTNAFSFTITRPAAASGQRGSVFGSNRGQVMCSSCHFVHRKADGTGSLAGTMLINNYGQSTNAVVCKSCHNGVGLPNLNDISKGGTGETANAHHRTATAVTIGQHTPSGETGSPLTITRPSWSAETNTATPVGLGITSASAAMDCADCHVFNGTAHNW